MQNGVLDSLLRVIFQLRVWATRLVYDRILAFIVTDEDWRERLLGSLNLREDRQALIIGPFSFSSALLFAQQYPNVSFCAVESHSSAKKYGRLAQRKGLANVRFFAVPTEAGLPFESEAFDTIVCAFALHHLAPAQKVATMRDLARVLRATGRLQLVELTEPQGGGEAVMLGFGGLIWGADAVMPHADGSWFRYLSQAGLESRKQDRSYSIAVARLASVAATKPGSYAVGSVPALKTNKMKKNDIKRHNR